MGARFKDGSHARFVRCIPQGERFLFAGCRGGGGRKEEQKKQDAHGEA
jgi:hypothetical protein